MRVRARTPGRQTALGLTVLVAFLVSGVSVALEVPHLSGQIVDLANMVPSDAEQRIITKLLGLERETGAQVAVLTVPSIERESIEEYTIRVVETWQLGRREEDDGVLLFVAQKERRLRLEVGYGLEGVLTDAMSRRILDNIVTPAFKQGDFGRGLEEAVDAIAALVRGEGGPPPVRHETADTKKLAGCVVALVWLFFFLVFPLLFSLLARKRGVRSRGAWSSPWIIGTGGGRSSGSFGGGGFGGFSGGGGGFGGGGASGGW